MAMQIIDRADATAQGLSKYFTGKPCKKGHICERYTKFGVCVDCTSEWNAKKGKEYRRLYMEKRRRACGVLPVPPKMSPEESRKRRVELAIIRRRAKGVKPKTRMSPQDEKASKKRRMHKWRQANQEKVRADEKKWRDNNPDKWRDKVRRIALRRRARLRGIEGNFTKADIDVLLAAQNGICAGCSKDISAKFEVDHKLAITRGGTNNPDNLQLLCRSCNAQKHTMTMEEWHARKA